MRLRREEENNVEYLVRVTRTTEFETVVDADDPLAAADMAKLEATGNSVIVDEKVDISVSETSSSDRLQIVIEREYGAEQAWLKRMEAEASLPDSMCEMPDGLAYIPRHLR